MTTPQSKSKSGSPQETTPRAPGAEAVAEAKSAESAPTEQPQTLCASCGQAAPVAFNEPFLGGLSLCRACTPNHLQKYQDLD